MPGNFSNVLERDTSANQSGRGFTAQVVQAQVTNTYCLGRVPKEHSDSFGVVRKDSGVTGLPLLFHDLPCPTAQWKAMGPW